MAVRGSAQDIAAKWARKAAASSQDYISGVQRVSTAPGVQAAAKKDKALAGYQEAINSGKWARNVAAVSLSDWQTQTTQVGAGRYSQGVQQKQSKMEQAMTRLIPKITQAQAQVANMPDMTVEDRINKSAAFQRAMHQAAQS